jgi:hypothetical protein
LRLLRVTLRRGPVGREPAEDSATARDRGVGKAEEPSGQRRQPQLHEQTCKRCAAREPSPVRVDEMDRRCTLGLGETGEQSRGLWGAERQERDAFVAVDVHQDARDEAAELAVRVVEEDWTGAHRPLVQAGRGIPAPVLS